MDTLAFITKVVKEMLSWREMLDIFLIAMGLFFAYRTLRRLGTWKIVLGIVIAAIIFVVANILDLRGIRWVYSNLSHVALIALIVIFQPEIRKVFERAASLRRQKIGKGVSDLSTLIADTVFSLSQQRHGALFVFPGKEPIKEWLSGGFSLNAEPSFPLIMSVFDPHSPGHDGAVVVENGKLVYFGVRLPMSKTDTLSDDFGTRHHAAMGISEVSDALVVVVSEERGSVMTFHSGRAKKVRDKNEISSRILSHWENLTSYPLKVQRGKRRWILFSEVAISMVLAFVFWATVIISQGEMREKSLSIPIEYIATPQNIALVGEKPAEVKLHLAGSKSDLDGINPSQLRAKIDLSKAMPGKQTFVVTEENVALPKKVSLLDAEPSSLVLSLEEIVEREVVVKPQLVGKLPRGLKLASVELTPTKIRALSPAGEKKQNEITVMTTPIYLESINETTTIFCKIIAPPSVQPVDKRWPDVEVLITVVYPK